MHRRIAFKIDAHAQLSCRPGPGLSKGALCPGIIFAGPQRRLSVIMLYHASCGNREKRRQSFIVLLTPPQCYKAVSCGIQLSDWTPMIEQYSTNWIEQKIA